MADLPSSKLGTKAHWDQVYEREINTFNDIGEEGEVWFGEDAVEVMVAWCMEHCEAATDLRILDVGSGNGHLLFALAEEGYSADYMVGADYSESSIKLCRDIAASRAGDGLADAERIQWKVVDILDQAQISALGKFDLILDKGTFDAISLTPREEDSPALTSLYPAAIHQLLKPQGLFCITSCNWTQDELESRFGSSTGLSLHSAVPKPKFTFGGQTGQTTCTVAFSKAAASDASA